MSLMPRILPPQNIVLDLPATSKKRAFEQAALLFENQHGVARTTVFQSLIGRERLGSTALGHSVAVPHGRIKDLKAPYAAFLRLSEPVQFDPGDGRAAHLLFFLLVPEAATQLHLDLLAEIARLLSNANLRQALDAATSVEEIHQLFTQKASA